MISTHARSLPKTQAPITFSLSEHLLPLRYGLMLYWTVFLGSFIARFFYGDTVCGTLNLIIPLTLLVGGLLIAGVLVLYQAANLFLPVFWYLVGCAAFYGLGALYPILGDDYGREVFDYVVGFDQVGLYMSNELNMLGINLILTVLYATSFLFRGRFKKFRVEDEQIIFIKRITVLLLSIGSAFQYLLILPYSFGFLTFVLPGVFFNMTIFLYGGLMFCAFLSLRVGGVWRFVFGGFFGLELIVGFLTLSKTSLLLVPLFALVGFFLARPQIRVLVLGGLVIIALYLIAKPLVAQGRILLNRRGGSASLQERSVFMQELIVEESHDSNRGERFAWWKRLSNSPFQVFAINQYDTGIVFDSFHTLPYVFVPRLLFPDKPNMTESGLIFNEIVFGSRSSSLAMTPFAESYWNGGYLYVVLVAMYIGLVFSCLAAFLLQVFNGGLWIYTPILIFSIKLSYYVTGWFVPTYVGGIVILFGMTFLLFMIQKLFLKKDPVSRSQQKTVRMVRRSLKTSSSFDR